ncbi:MULTISPECIES: hypothetical protein [Halomonadaceae]|uniref:Uncharacterized protein n=1 Tax=Halomonas sp. ZM3 TaxID=1250400 RepID=K7TFI9_9GAMM|nr:MULTISPECIES: hypothetical protein [unclassified Halomonas]AFW03520.1 hypothetical protein [Halomonas sp. ZM3]PKG51933.1 hypothetical protein CXF87_09680 [Halomonas sp. MES3-P3E]
MTTKKPVSARALLARINRQLAKDGQQMKTCPERSQWHDELGSYYIVDLDTSTIVVKGIDDLEEWTRREMDGVLKPFEALEG